MNDIFSLAKTVKIEDVVGKYIPLQEKGPYLLGLCPFHNDKHLGSFMVTPGRQKFTCWACGESGDAIDFVSKYLKISSFESAVRICEENGLISHNDAERLLKDKEYKYTPSSSVAFKRPEVLLVKKKSPEELYKAYAAFVHASRGPLPDSFLHTLYDDRKLAEEDLKDFFEYPNPSSAFWNRFRTSLREVTGLVSAEDQDKFLIGIPGFFMDTENHVTFLRVHSPSLGIIIRDRYHRISGIQLRTMTPTIAEGEPRYRFMSSGFANGKSTSKNGCVSGTIEDVLFPKKWCRAIAITEGRFKAIALKKMGFITVNMHGITNWKKAGQIARELAEQYGANRYVLVYDQEVNPAVDKSRESLIEYLKGTIPIDIAVWDKQYGKGIDDVVNAGYRDKISRMSAFQPST